MMGSGESAEATADYFKRNYAIELKEANNKVLQNYQDEHPQHRVPITEGIFSSDFITSPSRQFRKFVEDDGYKTDAEKDGKGASGYDAAQGQVCARSRNSPGGTRGLRRPTSTR